ncbi:hypothetical protein FQZ97_931180 [compost metagenome]
MVVTSSASGVSVTHGNHNFQVDTGNFAGKVVQLGFAFWLEHGFVEVEERIGSVGNFGRGRSRCGGRSGRGACGWGRCRRCSRSRCRSSHRNNGAVATDSGSCRRPVCIAPAQFIGTVFPDQFAGAIAPVVDGLGAGGRCHGGRCDQHCHFVEFFHGFPLGKPQTICVQKKTLEVTTTQNAGFHCATSAIAPTGSYGRLGDCIPAAPAFVVVLQQSARQGAILCHP